MAPKIQQGGKNARPRSVLVERSLGAPGVPKSLQHLKVPDYGNISEDMGTN